MAKSLSKVAAIALSAGLVLGGAVSPSMAVAEETTTPGVPTVEAALEGKLSTKPSAVPIF